MAKSSMMHRFGMNDTDEDSGMSGGQILLWILVGSVDMRENRSSHAKSH